MNLISNKFEFLYQKKQHPSSWDDIPYWEFEEYVKMMNKRIKEENENAKKEREQQQSMMPKFGKINPNLNMPKMGNFKR